MSCAESPIHIEIEAQTSARVIIAMQRYKEDAEGFLFKYPAGAGS